jgi:hypothetical protein
MSFTHSTSIGCDLRRNSCAASTLTVKIVFLWSNGLRPRGSLPCCTLPSHSEAAMRDLMSNTLFGSGARTVYLVLFIAITQVNEGINDRS